MRRCGRRGPSGTVLVGVRLFCPVRFNSPTLLPFNACPCLPMLIRHPLCVCLNIISPVCLTIQPFPTQVCLKENALQPFSQSSSTPTVPQVFQIGLCGVIEADLDLFGNSWSGGILRDPAVFLDFTVPRCGIHPPWCLPPSSRTASRGGSPSPVGCEGMPAKHRRAGLRPVACRPLPVGPSPVAPARSTSNQVRSRWLNAADRSASVPVSRATRIISVGSTAATLPTSLVRLPARTASVAGLSAKVPRAPRQHL